MKYSASIPDVPNFLRRYGFHFQGIKRDVMTFTAKTDAHLLWIGPGKTLIVWYSHQRNIWVLQYGNRQRIACGSIKSLWKKFEVALGRERSKEMSRTAHGRDCLQDERRGDRILRKFQSIS